MKLNLPVPPAGLVDQIHDAMGARGEDFPWDDSISPALEYRLAEAFERIGMPEGRFPLAQAAIYLATAPKSNTAFAFFDALATVETEQETEVPNHLRDGNRDSEGFGHGQGYLYPHAYRDHWVAQQYLPDGLQGKVFYDPSDQGYEQQIGRQVARLATGFKAYWFPISSMSVNCKVLTSTAVVPALNIWKSTTKKANPGGVLGSLGR